MNGYTTDLPTNMENSRNCLRRIARHDDQEFSNQSILNAMEKFVKSVNTMDETILVPCRLMDRKVGDSTDTIPVAPKAQHYGAHHGKKSNRASTRELLNTSELFQLYNTLKLVKVDLLWGRQDAEDGVVEDSVVMGCTTKSSASSKSSSSSTGTAAATAAAHSNTTSDSSAAIASISSASSALSPAGSEKVEAANSSNSSTSPATTQTTTATSSSKGHNRRPSTVSVASSNSASTLSDSESETSAENDSGIESEGNQEHDRSAELAKQFRTHLLGLYRSLEQMSEAANYLTTRYQSDVGPV